jgi:hypothetical protein
LGWRKKGNNSQREEKNTITDTKFARGIQYRLEK